MTPEYPDWAPRWSVRLGFVLGCVVAAAALTMGVRGVAAFVAAGSVTGLVLAGVCCVSAVALFERTLHVTFDRRFGVAAVVAVAATALVLAMVDVPQTVFEELAR